LGDRQRRNRIPEVRRNLRQRTENKSSLPESGMRDFQPRLTEHRRSKQDEIEIQAARGTGVWSRAPGRLLDVLKGAKQIANVARRLANGGSIQERRLDVRHVHGLGFDRRRHSKVREQPSETFVSECEMGVTVAEIRAERDRDSCRATQSSELEEL